MNNLRTRIITGFLYGASLILSLSLGPYTFGLFFLIVTILGLKEFYRIQTKLNNRPSLIGGFGISTLIYLFFFLNFTHSDIKIPLYNLSVLFLTFIVLENFLLKKKNLIRNFTSTILGVIYIALPFSLLITLAFNKDGNYNFGYVLSLFICVWLSDSGGYFIGSKYGKNKLFKSISPNKTIEGAFGSILFTLIGCIIISFMSNSLSFIEWMFFGIIVSLSSIVGDLIESAIKRKAAIKDSGTLLPGHGGILDRFDSILLVVPITYFYLNFIS